MIKYLVILLLPAQLFAQPFNKQEIARWQRQAKQVNIIRDKWGIPHVYGKTDADCVFGLMYAQCEDDFKRVERNYINVLGRTAELLGEGAVYDDLFTRIVLDSAGAVADYQKSEPWLRLLLQAYADGINYFLQTHPDVHPALLSRFQPWYPLMWTDGSISAIETGGITPDDVKNFYTRNGNNLSVIGSRYKLEDTRGSNGFAVAPSRTATGNAILYINPHVTFYFRPEVHMISEQGLNAYGAVTWGQFFVYQGFNEHCGWMHTSGYTDVADLYSEQVTQKGAAFFYKYDNEWRPVTETKIAVAYKDGATIAHKTIKVFSTHHGPIMAQRDGKWISVRANNRSMKGLIQSWRRTKADGFEAFKKNMELLANCSNNTVFADDKGNIAYWHGNFIPRRDTSFNWTQPVDGTTHATEWKGLHTVDEGIHVYNPSSGWIQNCNSTPFTASGSSSPMRGHYPSYMSVDQENFRGLNAVRLLSAESAYTIDKMIATGYDNYLTAFKELIPALINAFDKMPSDTMAQLLKEPIAELRKWDLRCNASSIATTLAIEWGQRIQPGILHTVGGDDEWGFVEKAHTYAQNATLVELTGALATVIKDLDKRFGTWRVQWGDINRYQRLTDDLQQKYDDNRTSRPDGMVASTWGCLPSFVSQQYPGTMKRYGYNGNSFVCVVEFGKRIKAKSLLTGGESSDPASKHFADQAEMYTTGKFKDVLFYREDIMKESEKSYHPGIK